MSPHQAQTNTHDEKELKLEDGKIDEASTANNHKPTTSSTTDEEEGVTMEDNEVDSTEEKTTDAHTDVKGAKLAVVTVAILISFFLVALVSSPRSSVVPMLKLT
jgi:hypothetical protein